MPGSAPPRPGRPGRRRPSGPACGRPTSRCSARTATSRCAGSRSAWSSSARSSAASSRARSRRCRRRSSCTSSASERAYQPFMPLFNGKRVDVGGYFQQHGRRLLHHAEHRGRRARLPDDLPRVRAPAGRQRAGRRAGVVQRGAGRVRQHLPDVRRARGHARPRQGGARLRRCASASSRSPSCSPSIIDSPLYNEGDRRGVFYAESWALVHYLLIGNPQRKGQLGAYLQKYADGVPSAARGPRGLRRHRSRAREGAARLRPQSLYRSTRVQLHRQGGDRQGLDRRSAERRGRPGGLRGSAAARCAGPRTPRPAPKARSKLTPDHARAQAVLARIRAVAGPGGRRGDADRGRGQGGRRHRLPARLLPGACRCCGGEGQHAPTITPDAARQALALLARVTTLAAVARRRARTRRLRGAGRRRSEGGDGLRRHRVQALAAARVRAAPRPRPRLHARPGGPAGARRPGRARLERLGPPRSAGAAELPRQCGEHRSPMASAAASAAPAGTVDGSTAPARPAEVDPGVPRRR